MFGLTEEQKQLQSAVRAFAEGEIAPHVSEWDEKSEFPHAVVKKLGEMGLLGVIFPEELGGAGMGYVEYVLAVEELSRVDGSVGIIVAAHNSLCTNHIMLAGNDEQRKRWIPKLASGQWLGASPAQIALQVPAGVEAHAPNPGAQVADPAIHRAGPPAVQKGNLQGILNIRAIPQNGVQLTGQLPTEPGKGTD